MEGPQRADVGIGPYEEMEVLQRADVGIGPYEEMEVPQRADEGIGPYEETEVHTKGRCASIGPYGGDIRSFCFVIWGNFGFLWVFTAE